MNLGTLLKRLSRHAKKRRSKPFAISFPIVKPIKGKRMSDKIKTRELIRELQETIDTQTQQLTESVKLISALNKSVATLQDEVNKLKQLCSVGQ